MHKNQILFYYFAKEGAGYVSVELHSMDTTTHGAEDESSLLIIIQERGIHSRSFLPSLFSQRSEGRSELVLEHTSRELIFMYIIKVNFKKLFCKFD